MYALMSFPGIVDRILRRALIPLLLSIHKPLYDMALADT